MCQKSCATLQVITGDKASTDERLAVNNLLSNYYGHVSYDGGSTLYNISFGDEVFNIYKCNSLSGNKNIYIGTSDMEYMCN